MFFLNFKTMKYFLIIFLLILYSVSMSQVRDTLRCKIVDSSSSLPIANGKAYIIQKADTLSANTIINGFFFITCPELLKPVTYLVIVSDGYQENKQTVDSAFCTTDLLREIKLVPHAKVLENIVIQSKPTLIRQDIDKITYNVQQDPESKSISVLEMMRKLPFVSLTADDNPMLKGNTNFLVLLDGKRSSLFSYNNLREALRAIPASTILRIEIITDPPPRFEGEGFAGVINIITLKRINDGYNGSINLNVGNFISGASASLNLRKQKLGVTFFGGTNFERTPFNYIESKTINSLFKIIQNGKTKINSTPKYTNLLVSYEIDTLNLVNLSVGVALTISKIETNTNAFTQYSASNSSSFYNFLLKEKNLGNNWDANINYQRNFKKDKNRVFTASYRFNNNTTNGYITNILTRRENFEGLDYLQNSQDGLKENAVQLDYVHPIKKIQIEAGAKYIYRDIFNNFITSARNPATSETYIDSSNTDNLHYDISIMGIYNSYSVRLKRFSLRAGFRYERTWLNGGFNFSHYKISQQYDNLLPSFKVQYQLINNAVYSLGFTQRLQRPGIGLLSPLVIKIAPGFEKTGNPYLNPVLANNISFGFSKFRKATVSVMVNYSFSKNTIQSFATTVEEDTLILTSYRNIGNYDRVGMDINTRFQVTPKIDFSVEGSINRVYIKNNDLNNKSTNTGVEGFIYSYLNYKGKNGWLYTANVGFYGPTINIQATSNSYYYSSLGMSKQIFKTNGNLSFRVANPFQRYRFLQSKINTSDIEQIIDRRNAFRAYYISLYFKFGKLDKEMKRNRRSIQIDDAASETGKQQ